MNLEAPAEAKPDAFTKKWTNVDRDRVKVLKVEIAQKAHPNCFFDFCPVVLANGVML